jgi:hypothetical protein
VGLVKQCARTALRNITMQCQAPVPVNHVMLKSLPTELRAIDRSASPIGCIHMMLDNASLVRWEQHLQMEVHAKCVPPDCTRPRRVIPAFRVKGPEWKDSFAPEAWQSSSLAIGHIWCRPILLRVVRSIKLRNVLLGFVLVLHFSSEQ